MKGVRASKREIRALHRRQEREASMVLTKAEWGTRISVKYGVADAYGRRWFVYDGAKAIKACWTQDEANHEARVLMDGQKVRGA